MNIWKASFAAALLVLPVSFSAFAQSITLAQPTQPAYGSYNPGNPGYGGLPPGYQNQMIPGGVQQYYNTIMSTAGTPQAGQQQPGLAMNGANPGQPAPQVQYHYKNPNPSNGSIPDDQLPQRLFHNIPPHYYGVGTDCTCSIVK